MAQHSSPTILCLFAGSRPDLEELLSSVPGADIIYGRRAEEFGAAVEHATVLLHWAGTRETLREVFLVSPKLQWVHLRFAGLDSVLFPELIDSSIPVTNGRGVFGPSLGEFAILAVLFFAKDVPRLRRQQKEHQWIPFDMELIERKTLGIVGYGDIGVNVASRAHAMGMQVFASRRHVQESVQPPLTRVFAADQVREMLPQCDYIVLATPLTAETHHLVDASALHSCKRNAVLINLSRGPVVDETALIDALRSGAIRGAALDVFEREPLPAESPLFEMENVLLSPHCADNHPEWLQDSARFFKQQLDSFCNGRPLENFIRKDLGY